MRPIHEPAELAALLDANAPGDQITDEFCPVLWLLNPDNIALRIGLDLAMFEDQGDGIWKGHIWFDARGALAATRAREMLDHMFAHHGAKAIRGEVPAYRKDVLAFVRHLGFRRVGTAMDPQGPVILCELLPDNSKRLASVA